MVMVRLDARLATCSAAVLLLPSLRVRVPAWLLAPSVSPPVVTVVSLFKLIAVALVVPMLRVVALAASNKGACTAVFAASVPPTVMVVPLSVKIESPIVPLAVNLAIVPVVPPGVVTPPPTPAQLPTVVHTS